MKKHPSKTQYDLMGEFRSALKIDKHSLDEELIRQPELFYRVAELHLRANADREAAKAEVDYCYAELDESIRGSQGNLHSKDKMKEKEIKSKIQNTPRWKKLNDAYLEARTRSENLGALKEAFVQRSYSLKDLTALYAANYFTTESGAKERGEAADREAEQVRRETGKMRRETFKERF